MKTFRVIILTIFVSLLLGGVLAVKAESRDVAVRKDAKIKRPFVKLWHGVRWTGRAAAGIALWLGLDGEPNERKW